MIQDSSGVPADALILTTSGLRAAKEITATTPLLTDRGVFISPAPRVVDTLTMQLVTDAGNLELGIGTELEVLLAGGGFDVTAAAIADTSMQIPCPMLSETARYSISALPSAEISPTILWLAGRWLAEGDFADGKVVFVSTPRLAPALETVLTGSFRNVSRLAGEGRVRLVADDPILSRGLVHFYRPTEHGIEKTLPIGIFANEPPAQRVVYSGFMSAEVAPETRQLEVGMRLLGASLGQSSPGAVISLHHKPVTRERRRWNVIREVHAFESRVPIYQFQVPLLIADGFAVFGLQQTPRS